MRKVTAFFLAVVMVFSMAATAFAASVTQTVDNTSVSAGSDVTVTITLDEAMNNVIGYEYNLYFNSDLFSVKESSGSATVSNVLNNATKGSYLMISYVDPTSAGVTVSAGTLTAITFTAKADLTEEQVSSFELVKNFVWDNSYTFTDTGDAAVTNSTVSVTVSAAACEHDWTDATCTTPKTCSKCGTTEGEAIADAHNYVDGVCVYCQQEKSLEFKLYINGEEVKPVDLGTTTSCARIGSALGPATDMKVTVPAGTEEIEVEAVEAPIYVRVNNAVRKNLVSHENEIPTAFTLVGTNMLCIQRVNGKGYHVAIEFTCAHNWSEANCTSPKICSICGETEGEAIADAHKYVDGVCVYCFTAEPTPAPPTASGYTFATSADVSALHGGTAVVKVKITGHSDPNVTSYNAYDLTLTFDSEKLEYVGFDGAVKSDGGEVKVDGNTIRIVGCGADKAFGTEIAALTFKTKGEGQANVTIDKVQVSDKEESVKEDAPEATPKHDEDDTTADETPDVSIIVVPYSVSKPSFITGNDKILHGETYTFSYTDTTNYTYSGLTVTVGGVAVENLVADENGVYTIENVTDAIVITATQTPNSYDVSKPKNVTGPDKATYGTPYIFTVTPSADDMAIDTVKVTLADGSEIPYTLNENGQYVIKGTDITGAFTITVTEKEKMTTVTFTGIKETEIEGGKLTMTAEIGKDFTFKLNKEEGYDYTVKVGETELTESEETAGQYTVPGELVVKGGVQVDITKEDNTKPVVDVTEYINLDGKTMFLITAKWRDKVLAYGEEGTMFWSDKYTVTGEEEAGAYCWLVVSTAEMNTIDQVKAAAEAAIVEAAEGATAIEVKYNYDINGTTIVDVNDAQLAYDMYNASYMEFSDNLPMLKFLEADMETDGKLDTKDVAAIINYIVSGANA